MPVKIVVRAYGVRDALGRFAKQNSQLREGMKEELKQTAEEIVKTYREEITASGIRSRSGRLLQGVHIVELTPTKAVVGPSRDREKVAEVLDEGVDEYDMPRKTGKEGQVYAMEKPGEGVVFRTMIGKKFIRPRNFMDKIEERTRSHIDVEFARRVTAKVTRD